MNQIDNVKLYKLAAIFFAIAGFSFLTAGMLDGFKTINLVLTAVFVLNSIIFFSIEKMKTKELS